ncbi:Hypothetical_protein [Hexamita inflata]|uniref:Hypothetical_protein n=1 Tax=Hexamita inflata TaxID=28002 RepID=A0AA86NEW2_9EUKA|nr:Hypothetical protein HINF_LOCUS5681 [Hexamita inflata]
MAGSSSHSGRQSAFLLKSQLQVTSGTVWNLLARFLLVLQQEPCTLAPHANLSVSSHAHEQSYLGKLWLVRYTKYAQLCALRYKQSVLLHTVLLHTSHVAIINTTYNHNTRNFRIGRFSLHIQLEEENQSLNWVELVRDIDTFGVSRSGKI